jgi:hypothetical protein
VKLKEVKDGPLDGTMVLVVTRGELDEIVERLKNSTSEDVAFLEPGCHVYVYQFREVKDQLDATEEPPEGWDEYEINIPLDIAKD